MEALEPIDVVDLFPEEREQLLRLLSSLSDEQWRRPTACAGWSVKDIALHLLGDDLGLLSRKRDGFDDLSLAGPGTDLSNWTELVAYINLRNEVWVQATRRISPQLLCDLLRFSGDATAAFFKSLDPAALSGPVSWAGPDPAPVWLDIAREYTERWVHQQHIRDAVGQPGLKDRRWFAPVLDAFVRAMPHTLRHIAAPDGTAVRLVITGEAGSEWLAVRMHEQWALVKNATTEYDATVTMDQEVAWRLFTKGLSQERAAELVRLDGDLRLAGTLLEMVSIIA